MTRLNGRGQQTCSNGMSLSPLHCLLCSPVLLVSSAPVVVKGPRTIHIYRASRKQGQRHTMEPSRLFDSSLMTALNRYHFRRLCPSCVVKRLPVLINSIYLGFWFSFFEVNVKALFKVHIVPNIASMLHLCYAKKTPLFRPETTQHYIFPLVIITNTDKLSCFWFSLRLNCFQRAPWCDILSEWCDSGCGV